jgi:asparagine synthetase B (glutamine-hydrolysing)
MCGLFGLVRTPTSILDSEASRRGAIIVRALGVNSEERGVHSAGLAFLSPEIAYVPREPTKLIVAAKEFSFNNVHIVKSPGRFTSLEISEVSSEKMVTSSVVLGHTRYATQGAIGALENASPMIAGSLVGTHNGDVLKTTIPGNKTFSKFTIGTTDSELLYLALNNGSHSRQEMTQVLRKSVGRVGLAFIDRSNTDRLYLVRGALSPMSYAWTQDGDFVYASNPDWFRRIERETKGHIVFSNITLLPEGRMVTVNTSTGQIEDVRKFTPSCRDSDLHLIRTSVYKRFVLSDRQSFESISRRKIYATTVTRTWAEPLVVMGYKEPEFDDTIYDPTLPPPLFQMDEDPIEDWDLDVESIEELCYYADKFDEISYTDILQAESEEEGFLLYSMLYQEVLKLYDQGLTRNGFTFDKITKP